jgi:RNA polymerase sigma factor (sigma-70 family)
MKSPLPARLTSWRSPLAARVGDGAKAIWASCRALASRAAIMTSISAASSAVIVLNGSRGAEIGAEAVVAAKGCGDPSRRISRSALRHDVAKRVHAAMGELKDEQAEVLYLRFIRHLSVAETGAVMGKSEGAIKALQYRALKALARQLPDELASPS